jgi:siroheme decarboxylase
MPELIDALDRQLIRLTQAGLPLLPQPYQYLAEQLQISAEEVMQRLQAMRDNGAIRRIAAVPNHYRLGYTFNGMTVWDVDDRRVSQLGPQVAALPFVSHCYLRPRHRPQWPYNLFAMIHAKTREQAEQQVEAVAALLGRDCVARHTLYSSKILKKTGLRIQD